MPSKKPTWQDRLNNSKGYPREEEITGRMTKKWGTGTPVVPAPVEVNELMKKVPKGKHATINEIPRALAKKHEATLVCPLTTGIFDWIASYAAEEQKQQCETDITSYWRTLKTGGFLNEKYPGGLEAQKLLLEQEGHLIMQRGKRFFVKDYLRAILALDQKC
jgi:hypothetical protein